MTSERAQQGATFGALAGAAAGLLSGADDGNDRLRNTAAGAAVGALIGGATGAFLEAQARELRGTLGNGIEVIEQGDQLIVRMPQDVLFDFDSEFVRSDLQADLFTLADSLQRYPDSTVTITGHTDNVGDAGYNFDLSERRARAVVAVLIRAGVTPARLRAVGAGENEPIASNLTPEGQAQNRRVDITIRPN